MFFSDYKLFAICNVFWFVYLPLMRGPVSEFYKNRPILAQKSEKWRISAVFAVLLG